MSSILLIQGIPGLRGENGESGSSGSKVKVKHRVPHLSWKAFVFKMCLIFTFLYSIYTCILVYSDQSYRNSSQFTVNPVFFTCTGSPRWHGNTGTNWATWAKGQKKLCKILNRFWDNIDECTRFLLPQGNPGLQGLKGQRGHKGKQVSCILMLFSHWSRGQQAIN